MDLIKSAFGVDTLSSVNSQFKVLVVEDDDISYLLLDEILSDYPIDITRAHDGEEAINSFKKEKFEFDLVLMDIRLPKISGYEATKEIKKINSSVPVIAVTACAHSQGVIECFESGCDDFIAKPFDIHRITRKIESYLVLRN